MVSDGAGTMGAYVRLLNAIREKGRKELIAWVKDAAHCLMRAINTAKGKVKVWYDALDDLVAQLHYWICAMTRRQACTTPRGGCRGHCRKHPEQVVSKKAGGRHWCKDCAGPAKAVEYCTPCPPPLRHRKPRRQFHHAPHNECRGPHFFNHHQHEAPSPPPPPPPQQQQQQQLAALQYSCEVERGKAEEALHFAGDVFEWAKELERERDHAIEEATTMHEQLRMNEQNKLANIDLVRRMERRSVIAKGMEKARSYKKERTNSRRFRGKQEGGSHSAARRSARKARSHPRSGIR